MLPLPDHAVLEGLAIIAAVVVLAAFWTPAIASLSDTAEATGVAYTLVIALVNAG